MTARFAAFVALWSLSCGEPIAQPPVPVVGEVATYYGLYSYGFETSSFTPCNDDEQWWARGRKRFGIGVPLKYEYGSRFLGLEGSVSEIGKWGHLGHYDRELVVDRVFLNIEPGESECPNRP